MFESILIIDPDPKVGASLDERLGQIGLTSRHVATAEEALPLILVFQTDFVGLLTAVHLSGERSGWDIARLARQANPDLVVAYRAAERRQDWRAFGVPGSVLFGARSTDIEMREAFLRLCTRTRGGPDQWANAANFFPNRIALHTETKVLPPSPETLTADRELLRTLFEKAPSFIAALEGPDHRFTFANHAYLEVVERVAVVGRTVLESFPEVVSQGFIALLDQVYRTGQPFRAEGVELSIRRPEGGRKTLFLDFLYHPVRDAAGVVTGIFVQGNDVTERHAAQEQVKQLQNDLIHVARLNALGTLVSALAHELNQPLTAIANHMATATILSEREQQSAALIDCLQCTGEAALRAGHVIRRLREMATRRDFTRQPMTLDTAVRETIALAGVGQFGCTIELGALSDTPVLADRIQIQQVLLNLLQNAFEAGGARPCHVLVTAIDRGALVEVAVTDSGPGIAPELASTLFESFVTTKLGGMGVGLSICRTIVEAHGGGIAARNDADGGARFSFTLPMAEA